MMNLVEEMIVVGTQSQMIVGDYEGSIEGGGDDGGNGSDIGDRSQVMAAEEIQQNKIICGRIISKEYFPISNKRRSNHKMRVY
jgi:hypothetical protein